MQEKTQENHISLIIFLFFGSYLDSSKLSPSISARLYLASSIIPHTQSGVSGASGASGAFFRAPTSP